MRTRTITTGSGEVIYSPDLLDEFEHVARLMGADGDMLLRSIGYLHVVKFMESREDLSAAFSDELSGELFLETQRFMESFATSRISDDSDVLD